MLVAVSGGGDSVGLALALSELASAHSLGIVLSYFDHKTREPGEHRADRACVHALSEHLNVPVVFGAAAHPPDRRRVTDRGGGEAHSREERYRFLHAASRLTGARYCATAHTRDDQIETVAMRLLAGISSPLLSGIPDRRHTQYVTFIRPALAVSGCALRELAQLRGLSWREDATNESLKYRRNVIRHVVLPAARTVWPLFEDDMLLIARSYGDRSVVREGTVSELQATDRAGRTIFSAAKFYELAPEARLSFLYRVLYERGLISRLDRPGHRFFAPLVDERKTRNGVILEGRGLRFVMSGPRIELSRIGESR